MSSRATHQRKEDDAAQDWGGRRSSDSGAHGSGGVDSNDACQVAIESKYSTAMVPAWEEFRILKRECPDGFLPIGIRYRDRGKGKKDVLYIIHSSHWLEAAKALLNDSPWSLMVAAGWRENDQLWTLLDEYQPRARNLKKPLVISLTVKGQTGRLYVTRKKDMARLLECWAPIDKQALTAWRPEDGRFRAA